MKDFGIQNVPDLFFCPQKEKISVWTYETKEM